MPKILLSGRRTCMLLAALWSTNPFHGTVQPTKESHCQASVGSSEKYLLVPQPQPGSCATENARRDPKSKICMVRAEFEATLFHLKYLTTPLVQQDKLWEVLFHSTKKQTTKQMDYRAVKYPVLLTSIHLCHPNFTGSECQAVKKGRFSVHLYERNSSAHMALWSVHAYS